MGITVPIPAGTSLISAPAGCGAAFGSTTTVTYSVGALAAGQSHQVVIEVRPERAGAVSETASVTADQADYNPSNDTATTASVASVPTNTGPAPVTSGVASALAALLGKTITVSSKGITSVRISCTGPATATCTGALDLDGSAGTVPALASSRRPAKAALLARTRFSIPGGRTATLRLTLGRPGMKLVRAHRSFSARVLLSTSGAGAGRSRTYTVTVKRGR